MSENELYDFIKDLQGSYLELYSFVAENCEEELTADEIDELVSDLQSDPLSLREFVINTLED